MTLYAQWEKDEDFNETNNNLNNTTEENIDDTDDVNNIVDNKNNIPNISIVVTDNTKLLDGKKKGYEFLGWYDENGNKIENTNEVPENTVLYAKYKKINVSKGKIKKIINKKSKKIKIDIKKINNTNGYEIQYSTSKKFKNKSTKKVTKKSTSVTISKLKKKKTYYVRVRAYKIDSAGKKIYGKWSTIKKIKIKK